MLKQIAYHRVSDDSVSSMMVPEIEIPEFIADWQASPDIDHIWTRDDSEEVDWEWNRN